jgi:cytochrome c oxidase cbb3-type subunit II
MQMFKDMFSFPYSDEEIANAPKMLEGKTELDALIAYMQGLGTALKTTR